MAKRFILIFLVLIVLPMAIFADDFVPYLSVGMGLGVVKGGPFIVMPKISVGVLFSNLLHSNITLGLGILDSSSGLRRFIYTDLQLGFPFIGGGVGNAFLRKHGEEKSRKVTKFTFYVGVPFAYFETHYFKDKEQPYHIGTLLLNLPIPLVHVDL